VVGWAVGRVSVEFCGGKMKRRRISDVYIKVAQANCLIEVMHAIRLQAHR
jgi:hypothetical protein